MSHNKFFFISLMVIAMAGLFVSAIFFVSKVHAVHVFLFLERNNFLVFKI